MAAGLKGFVARPRQLLDREFVGMLRSVKRFHALATAFLEQTTDDDTTTYGEFIRDGGFPESFTRLYAVPLVACVWSSGSGEAMGYPARYLFRFLEHHGMLTVGDSPQWMTVVGGSRTYVDALAERLPAVRSGDPVTSVLRTLDGVEVRTGSGRTETFDRIVLALHADDALGILADPTPAEKEVLGCVPLLAERDRAAPRRLPDAARSPRAVVVELPRRHRPGQGAIVTYWMNRLQGLPADEPFYVTLNATDRIDPATRRRDDAVPAPALRPRRRARPASPHRADHADDDVRRCLPRVGLPRGRLPLGGRGRRGLRGRTGEHGRRPAHPARPRRRPGPPHAPPPAQALLHQPALPVARRPRRHADGRPAGCDRSPSSGARTTWPAHPASPR